MDLARGGLTVSVIADPHYRWRGDKLVSVWHDWDQVRQAMVDHPKIDYELSFSKAATTVDSRILLQIIDSCHRRLSGISWREHPPLVSVIDIALAYPHLRQSLRLGELDLNGIGNSTQRLHKWRLLGISQIIIPCGEINRKNFNSFKIILSKIIAQGFEVRLEAAPDVRKDFLRKILANRGLPAVDSEIYYGQGTKGVIKLIQNRDALRANSQLAS